MRRSIHFNAVLILLLLLPGCAAYVASSGKVAVKNDRPVSRPEPRTAPATGARDTRVAMVAGFSTRDRMTIEEYFEKQRSAHPRQESLPAGFAAHDRLPVQIHGQPLPRLLETKLTVLPDAYLRLQVGHDVLLMERDSRIVLDLLLGVIVE